MLGPLLEHEAVRLEAPTREDLRALAKRQADFEATRYLLSRQFPSSPKQHEDWLEKVATSQDDIVWVVVDRSDTTLIGFCGFELLPRPLRTSRHTTAALEEPTPSHQGHAKHRRRGHA